MESWITAEILYKCILVYTKANLAKYQLYDRHMSTIIEWTKLGSRSTEPKNIKSLRVLQQILITIGQGILPISVAAVIV